MNHKGDHILSHKSKHIMSAPHESQLRKRKKRKDKQKEGWKAEEESGSRSVVSSSLRPHGLWLGRLLCSWNSPGKNTGVGCHALLQGIFPTQGSNPGFPHCRWILYQLSHQGSQIYCTLLINASHCHYFDNLYFTSKLQHSSY